MTGIDLRQIDALIAKRIFGCRVRWHKLEWDSGGGPTWPFCGCKGKRRHRHENSLSHVPGLLPRYSEDIAAAWQVVEAFRQGWNGHAAACITLAISDLCVENDIACTIFAPDIELTQTAAHSAPLAICMAALQVAGLQEDDFYVHRSPV